MIFVRGFHKLLRFLGKVPGSVIKAEAAYTQEIAERIMEKSKSIVPLDQGPLQASGKVKPVERKGPIVRVELVYGEPGSGAEEYALIQHENLEYNHAPGRQAKYLEEPVVEAFGSYAIGSAAAVSAAIKREAQ